MACYCKPVAPKLGRLVLLADCAHGVGPALLDAFYTSHCRVVGFSPSRERLTDMKERYYLECDAGGVDLWRVDLGNDDDVRRNIDRAVSSHGPPDLVVTSLGCLPRAWHRRSVQGGPVVKPVELTSWSTPATDWTRFLGDVRGVTNVARHVLPEMLDAHAKNLTSTSAFVTIMHTLDPQWGEGTAAYRACRAALREMTSTLAHELPSGMIASMLEPTPLTEELAETVSSRSEAHHAARLSPQQVHDDRWAAAAVTFMLEELTSAHSGRTMQIPFAWPVASPQKDCTRLDAQKI